MQTRRAETDWHHSTPAFSHVRCIPVVGNRCILAPAFRTPPVRGKDRVHLQEIESQRFSRTSFSPALRTSGTTTKEVRHAKEVSRSSTSRTSQSQAVAPSGERPAARDTQRTP